MSDASPAAALTLQSLSKDFNGTPAVRDVSLQVEPGEIIVLLGPSGCGKTTTLRMIAGFVPPTQGDILLDGHSLVDVPAYDRDIGIVFQSYALFPHLTVARNIRFGLEMRRTATAAANARVNEMLRLVKLEAFAERLPRNLSGGQQQRVALARALAIHPRLLLLDEPLSNLDAALRQEMAREIRILQRDRGVTSIVVTHDQSEAMAMADRLVVMRDGGVEQIGRQQDLYERPLTPFVAGFIGQSNLLHGRLADGGLLLDDGGGRIALAGRYQASGPACLAIRPECIHLDDPDAAGARVQATIRLATYLGAVVEYVVRLDSGPDIILRGPATGRDAERRRSAGERASVMWGLVEELLFDQHGRPAVVAAG
jgi:putative spermidine/putrescine transport system ATP-binding protein